VKYLINSALHLTFALLSINVFAQASLEFQSVTDITGSAITVPVAATGIEDMTGFQFTIAYDNSKLEYVSCSNWGGGTRESGVQITPLEGKVTFVYNDDAVNIVSGRFFDMHFNIKAGTSGTAFLNWSDNPTMRELSNSVPEEINCEFSNGSILIENGTNPEISSPVATSASAVSQTGFTANWNAVANATGYYLDVSMNESFSTFLAGYNGKNVNNVTLFPVSGLTPGETYFYQVRAYNSEATSENSNTVSVTTQSESGESATLSIGTAEGTSGSAVTVPVTATGIEDMTGFQFTIEFDNSKLEYVSCSNWSGGTRESGVQITPLEGKVTFVYTDDAVNIASGRFFDLEFEIKENVSDTAEIKWSDEPTTRELSNSVPVEIPCDYTDGAVIVLENTPELITSGLENNSFKGVYIGNCSDLKSYNLTGNNLKDDVRITAPDGFEITANIFGFFTDTLELVPEELNDNNKTIYVRFCPEEARSFSGDIVHSSMGADTLKIQVNGNGEGDCFVFGQDGLKYTLTAEKYSETDDLSLAVKNEFGQNAEVADWNDLKTNFGNNIVSFLEGICIYESNPESAFVQWNGEYLYSSDRQYFLRRVDGDVPTGFLVHDDIANNTVVLGSWFDLNNKILAKIDTTTTNFSVLSNIQAFNVYPNPASEVLHISFNNTFNQKLQVELVTIYGKVLKQQTVSNPGNTRIVLSVSDLYPGLYLVRVNNDIRKIVITKEAQ
jgi:hypothetical protein